MKVSLVVPSKGCRYLKYLLRSLCSQDVKPSEVVVVVKGCDTRAVEKACASYGLGGIVLEQEKGFVTTALNMGKRVAEGDVVLFTDDDAVAPRGWVKRYVKAFSSAPKDVGCISSRDVYLDLSGPRVLPTKDDYPHAKLYRWLVRTWLEPPLDVLREYWLGVYITESLNVVHGPYLPDKACLSLPYRGVNMGFRGEILDIVEFPEHPLIRRALGFEQYAGLKLVLNGYKCAYIPSNPILHIHRWESLSRTSDKSSRVEFKLMRSLYRELLLRNAS